MELKHRLAEVAHGLAQGIVELTFPTLPFCALCGAEIPGREKLGICRNCLDAIASGYRRICLRCGRPLSKVGSGQGICIDCMADRPFDLARAAGSYDNPLKAAIYRLKFAGDASLSVPLGKLMSWRLLELVSCTGCVPDLIVPVPLHFSRLKQRGFNQAECLARVVSAEWRGIPVAKSLKRRRTASAQKQLGRSGRLKNLQGVFWVDGLRSVKGRNVLLIDDVITTGTTAEACALALKRAGAARVDVLVTAAVPAIPAGWG